MPSDELPRIYDDPAHYDLIASLTAPADLGFYERILARHGGPVLELGCGTGRLALPLAAAGAEVTAIDRSPALLAHARAKAEASGIAVAFHDADFRNFDLARRYNLVLLGYNAFNHLLDFEALAACLACVHRHLSESGRFVIDSFNPDPALLAVNPLREQRILEYDDPRRGRVVMFERNAYDAANQINRITWLYRDQAGEIFAEDQLAMRIYFPKELDALLVLMGFAVEDKLGDYDGSPFGARTPKQLMVVKSAR